MFWINKLHVNVADGLDSAEFLLFDDTACEIVGKRAREVVLDAVKAVDANGCVGTEFLECGHLFFPEAIQQKLEDHPPFGTRSVYTVDRVCIPFSMSSGPA